MPSDDEDEEEHRDSAKKEKEDEEMKRFAAKHLFCVPATSTPSSKAGYIVNKTRSSLLPEHIDKLIFLAHNMKRV
ncbi:hypothetical protein QQF64_011238 [Cirrhinus molitorella]|uniref:Uncharacterized protein n=1 Tax=Cirrhinus molitorella TaxID=172907 RepID=A0ABR3M1R4_9TELE